MKSLLTTSLFFASAAFGANEPHIHHVGCSHEHAKQEHEEHADPCDHEHEPADHENCSHDHADHEHDAPTLLTLDAKARAILDLRVEPVPAAGDSLIHSLYGTLRNTLQQQEVYSLPTAGRIELHIHSASLVDKGDLLYRLESPSIATAALEQEKSAAALTRCQAELASLRQRIAALRETGTRKVELEELHAFKQAQERELQAQLQLARRALTALSMGAKIVEEDGRLFLEVRAQHAGRVSKINLANGAWAEQGSAVLSMTDPQALQLVASLYAGDSPHFDAARATLIEGTEGRVIEGELRVDDQVDEERQTRGVYFLPAPGQLPDSARAGQICRIDLYLRHNSHDHHHEGEEPCEPSHSIPDSALIKQGLYDIVFLEHEKGQYIPMRVQVESRRMGMASVRGLATGQRLVTRGAYELKFMLPAIDGQPSKAAGHFHADGKFHVGEH